MTQISLIEVEKSHVLDMASQLQEFSDRLVAGGLAGSQTAEITMTLIAQMREHQNYLQQGGGVDGNDLEGARRQISECLIRVKAQMFSDLSARPVSHFDVHQDTIHVADASVVVSQPLYDSLLSSVKPGNGFVMAGEDLFDMLDKVLLGHTGHMDRITTTDMCDHFKRLRHCKLVLQGLWLALQRGW